VEKKQGKFTRISQKKKEKTPDFAQLTSRKLNQ
jgi:hypothetical protein